MTESKELAGPTQAKCLAGTSTFNVQDGACAPLNPCSPCLEKSLSPVRKFKTASTQVQISHTHAFLYWSITYSIKCRRKKNPKGEKIQINTNLSIFFQHCDAPSEGTTEGVQIPKPLASPVGCLCGALSPELQDSQAGGTKSLQSHSYWRCTVLASPRSLSEHYTFQGSAIRFNKECQNTRL